MRMKQKCFLKKQFQNVGLKKEIFKTTNSRKNFSKFLSIGPWIVLIDAKEFIWLKLYGREAVQRKLKNSLNTQKMHFLPVFELTSDSLTTI